MCGGIGFKIDKISDSDLELFYSSKDLEKIRANNFAYSFFWNEKAVLPVIENNSKSALLSWGNKDPNLKLPKTGWAKEESIEDGKWKYLKPAEVIIPAVKGYEKGKWFEVKGKGIKGIVISKDDKKYIYMVTKKANQKYLKKYQHDRQPIEV